MKGYWYFYYFLLEFGTIPYRNIYNSNSSVDIIFMEAVMTDIYKDQNSSSVLGGRGTDLDIFISSKYRKTIFQNIIA